MFSKKVPILGMLAIVLLFTIPSRVSAGKIALLIGIDDYSLTSGYLSLKGAGNDIDIMKAVLADRRFGFDQIITLYNGGATHSRIERAFKELAGKAGKGGIESVYIYYSGHGSQTPDLNGDEPKTRDLRGTLIPSYDQTWVTYGARLKQNAAAPDGFKPIDDYDILDDEIDQWLGEIAKACNQVVFVSDSCHSGSVSRNGITSGVRRGPADEREHPLGRNNFEKRSYSNIVSIGASRDNQLSREFLPDGSAEEYGVFTWHWVRALTRCLPSDTWSHVFNRVAQIVRQATPNRQHPQISGAVTMNVFGRDFKEPAATIPIYQVLPKDGSNRVYLAAGRLVGITEGSVYTLEGMAGRPDAPEIKVVKAAPTHSVAVTKSDVQVNDQVVETFHRYAFAPTRVLVKTEHANDVQAHKDVLEIINALPTYETVMEEQAADMIVYNFRPAKPPTHRTDGMIPRSECSKVPPPSSAASDLEMWILDGNGYLIQENLRHEYTPKGLNAFRQNLLRMARVKDLMQIDSQGKDSPLDVFITPMIPVPQNDKESVHLPNEWSTKACPLTSYRRQTCMPVPDFLSKKWDLCTMIQFGARNPTARPYYFYVVYFGPDGEIEPVFPSLRDTGQVAEIAPGSENIRGKAIIRLDTETVNHYKLIASRKPINHHLFFQTGYDHAVRGDQRPRQRDPLEQLLMDAVSGTRSGASYQAGTWYAETITVDMRSKGK